MDGMGVLRSALLVWHFTLVESALAELQPNVSLLLFNSMCAYFPTGCSSCL